MGLCRAIRWNFGLHRFYLETDAYL